MFDVAIDGKSKTVVVTVRMMRDQPKQDGAVPFRPRDMNCSAMSNYPFPIIVEVGDSRIGTQGNPYVWMGQMRLAVWRLRQVVPYRSQW